MAFESDGSEGLPPYAGMMADYHMAVASERRGVVTALRAHPGDLVLDMACGDGSYARWLAECVGPAGKVLAADVSPAFLMQSRVDELADLGSPYSLLDDPDSPAVGVDRLAVSHARRA